MGIFSLCFFFFNFGEISDGCEIKPRRGSMNLEHGGRFDPCMYLNCMAIKTGDGRVKVKHYRPEIQIFWKKRMIVSRAHIYSCSKYSCVFINLSLIFRVVNIKNNGWSSLIVPQLKFIFLLYNFYRIYKMINLYLIKNFKLIEWYYPIFTYYYDLFIYIFI